MCDPRTVIEGSLKYRDGRKWKSRWCVVTKLSPVADCLQVQLYRDSRERCKNGPTKASLSLSGCLGLESGFTLDKESHTLAVLCPELVLVLAFDSRELLIQWQVKIRANVADVHQFLVQLTHAPPRAKLSTGPARLHLQDHRFCLTAGVPPRILGTWPLKELRRFGLVDGKFCFEGGSKCGRGEGLHILHTNQTEELSQAFEAAAKGQLATKKKMTSKITTLETPSRMSLQPRLHNQDSSHCCSTESRRPLLGSTCSDGNSSCDACSEIVRFASDTPVPDDFFQGKAFCKVHYRWPSCMSHCGPASSICSSEVESVDTVSLTISDIQEPTPPLKSPEAPNEGPLQVPGGPCLQPVLTYTHCNKCGRHYCARSSFPALDQQPPQKSHHSPEQTAPTGFSPHWTMDLRVTSASAAGDTTVQTRSGLPVMSAGTRTSKPADRASVCSQSSGTSSTSAGSASTSSSEYNVPRNFLESFYDHPRNLLHLEGDLFRVPSCASSDRGSGLPTPSPMGDSLPGIHGHSTCPCWNRVLPNRCSRVTRSSSGSSDSPLVSPKKASSQQPFPGAPQTVFQCHAPKSPCTCSQGSVLYPNYDVPRTALANMYLRERQACQAAADTASDKARLHLPPAGQHYDVPRYFKDKLLQQEAKTHEKSAHVRTMCTCGTVISTGVPHVCKEQNVMDHLQSTCTCHQVVCWPGNLVPCWRTKSNDDCKATAGQGSFFVQNLQAQTPGSLQQGAATICQEPSRKPSGPLQKHLPQSRDLPKTQNPAGTPTASTPNYANIHFLESLSLYQNTGSLACCTTEPESTQEDVELKRCAEDKPPLPPRNGSPAPSKAGSAACSSVEASPEKYGSLKRSAVRGSPSNTSGESYEVMSFRTPPEHLTLICDENYVIMHPVGLPKQHDGKQKDAQHGDRMPLPLRPFMPYLLPCREECPEELFSECDKSRKGIRACRSPFFKRKHMIIQEVSQSKSSTLSSSLGDLKKKVLMRRRSNSADGRQDSEELSEAEDYPGQRGACSKATPSRKHSLLSKLSLRSRQKSRNINDITPPSSVPSTPNSRSLENLYKIPFHRSADCLKLKGDFVFSEEDLTKDADTIDDVHQSTSSIKRSSSVPCKPREMEQATSPSDSGVSTSLPLSSETVCELGNNNGISIHASLPRRVAGAARGTTGDENPDISIHCSPARVCTYAQSCDAIRHDHLQHACHTCPQHGHYTIPGDRYVATASKGSSGSTTSSDSDYIETMSLCSSGSGGSSSEYLRPEDLGTGSRTLAACPVSCILKPRSAKEYNSVDRTGIREEEEERPESPARCKLHAVECCKSHAASPVPYTFPKTCPRNLSTNESCPNPDVGSSSVSSSSVSSCLNAT